MKRLIILIITIIFFITASPKGRYEKDYQKVFALWIQGKTEVTLSDKTRVDILTDIYAIEVDFAKKWAESIGQSLFYSLMTGKKPGVVLIMKAENDKRFLKRLMKVSEKYNIQVWLIDKNFKISSVKK